jgi:hypothetical protein
LSVRVIVLFLWQLPDSRCPRALDVPKWFGLSVGQPTRLLALMASISI